MDVEEQLQRDGLLDDDLIRLFKQAQEELIRIVEKANPDSPFRSYRAQQLRAIDAVLVRLGQKARRWTEREIPRLVAAGAAEAEQIIRGFDEQEFQMDFAGVPESAVKVLAEEAFLEFGNTMVALRRNMQRAVIQKRKLAEKLVTSVIQGSSVARTQNQLIDLLRKDGVDVLRARNGFGRRFSLEHYTNLLVRTQSMTAYNQGAKAQMLGVGRRFAIFPTIRPDIDGEDVCNEWERRKYVDLTKDPLPPASTHPNCRHRVIPVSFDQLKAERPDLYRLAVGYFRDASRP